MAHNPQRQTEPVRAPSGSAKACSSTGNGNATIKEPASITPILDSLECVRPYGGGYTARCPAHKDRTASLSVTAGNDGRILVYCFAGCSVHAVMAAIGFTISDLFPRRLPERIQFEDDPLGDKARRHERDGRQQAQAYALRSKLKACGDVLDLEAKVVLIACGDIERGKTLSEPDHQRLAIAAERIRDARVAIAGRG